MLRIRSLAACLNLDPTWVLNNAEMSRLHLRGGGCPGELFVEIVTEIETDYEIPKLTAYRFVGTVLFSYS